MVILLYFLWQNSGQLLHGCVFVAAGGEAVDTDADADAFPVMVVDGKLDPVRKVRVLPEDWLVAFPTIEAPGPDVAVVASVIWEEKVRYEPVGASCPSVATDDF